jgi:serine acetyltransferase
VRIVGRADHIRIGSRVQVGPSSLIWAGDDGNVVVVDIGAPARVVGRRIDSPYSRPSRTCSRFPSGSSNCAT